MGCSVPNVNGFRVRPGGSLGREWIGFNGSTSGRLRSMSGRALVR
jgi:hypothetical protein